MAIQTESQDAERGDAGGVVTVDLPFDPGSEGETTFSRADLLLSDVDHAHLSYEVRVYFNNANACAATPRAVDQGYAGRFVILGHGNCFGDPGHCDVSVDVRYGARGANRHPVAPKDRTLTVTTALRHVLDRQRTGLKTVTFVPVSKAPKREHRGPCVGLFKYGAVSLQTYR